MFITITNDNGSDNVTRVVFIESSNIKVSPCGKRGTTGEDTEGGDSAAENAPSPFDPESRLNTEASNRKRSGINGFTSTFIKNWDSDSTIALVLDGYLFEISCSSDFITAITTELQPETDKIYANILLQEVPLYADNELEYKTEILRDQSNANEGSPALSLDLLMGEAYYFSGLSFTTAIITPGTDQRAVSLCVLEKKDNEWKVCQTSFLPKIEHGNSEDSVKIDELEVKKITAETITLQNASEGAVVPTFKLAKLSGDLGHQLQFFTGGTINSLN